MTRPLHRTLRTLLGVLALASSLPAVARAQPAGTTRSSGDTPTDALTAQEREVLAAAQQLGTEAEQLIEQWIVTQVVTEARMFGRLYFPIAGTDPQKYATPYDALADRDVVIPEDKALARSPTFLYAILTDANGYVPAHNSRFAQALTKDSAQNYINNRTKRMLGDTASLLAARSEAHYLIQRTKLETGDVIYDLSVPVTVRGKHWGCVRIGYRRTES
jgi:methyl-accepting chemotaxis protein